jgi:hypothetical protein
MLPVMFTSWLLTGTVLSIPRLERILTRSRRTSESSSESALTQDRLIHDSLVGIRLLAEMGRSTVAPGQEILRLLNHRMRLWKVKAQKLAEDRNSDRLQRCKKRQKRNEANYF